MDQPQHSPLPWTFTVDGTGQPDSVKKYPDTGEVYQEPGCLLDGYGKHLAHLRCGPSMLRGEDAFRADLLERFADAELIVRAVNSHEELLAVAQEALDALVDDGFVDSGPHSIVAKLRSALTKAKGVS